MAILEDSGNESMPYYISPKSWKTKFSDSEVSFCLDRRLFKQQDDLFQVLQVAAVFSYEVSEQISNVMMT